MIRRLIILLLIVGCVFGDTIIKSSFGGDLTIKDVTFIKVEYSMAIYEFNGKELSLDCSKVIQILDDKDKPIPNSCVVDCAGELGGSAFEDCQGICGGDAIEDKCGVCDGGNSTCIDCAGVPNGLNIEDCAGVCGGSSQVDECGVCGGSGILEGECDCYGEKENIYGNCGSDSFDNKKLFLLIEGNYGIVKDVNSNFNQVYGNSNNISSVGFGIGWKNTYLIAKYKQFEANGKSLVSGIDLEGVANWKEEFIILALRYYEGYFFTELGYVLNSVEEVISTNQPIYTDLISDYSTNGNEGMSIVLGLNIPIDGLILSTDVNYIYVLSKTEDESNNKTNVGGLMFNVGLGIKL